MDLVHNRGEAGPVADVGSAVVHAPRPAPLFQHRESVQHSRRPKEALVLGVAGGHRSGRGPRAQLAQERSPVGQGGRPAQCGKLLLRLLQGVEPRT